MSLISLVLVLVVFGVLLYVIETLIPMDAAIKKIIQIVVVLAVVIYLLQAFGLLSGPVPRLK